jgi:hypothetical protein
VVYVNQSPREEERENRIQNSEVRGKGTRCKEKGIGLKTENRKQD